MYQPKLLPRQIRALYLLKLRDKKPMTRLLREAVDRYLAQQPELEGLDLEGIRCLTRISRREWSETIDRAFYARAATVEHVRVDHRRLDAAVTEQFLDGSDVVPAFEQVGGEGVTKRVAGCGFGERGLANCRLEGTLDRTLVQVMPTPHAAARIAAWLGGREHVLPAEVVRRVRVLSSECMGQLDARVALRQGAEVRLADTSQLTLQSWLEATREHADSILVALAAADDDRTAAEVEILHA